MNTYQLNATIIKEKIIKIHSSTIWCYPSGRNIDYRLCQTATNSWLGIIENYDGDLVLDLVDWAAKDFIAAFAFAQLVVKQHNVMRHSISLDDYSMITELKDI